MRAFIGSKIILAEPMSKEEFEFKFKNAEEPAEGHIPTTGFHVAYPDGYHSWTPTSAFEGAYRPVSDSEVGLIDRARMTKQAEEVQ